MPAPARRAGVGAEVALVTPATLPAAAEERVDDAVRRALVGVAMLARAAGDMAPLRPGLGGLRPHLRIVRISVHPVYAGCQTTLPGSLMGM